MPASRAGPDPGRTSGRPTLAGLPPDCVQAVSPTSEPLLPSGNSLPQPPRLIGEFTLVENHLLALVTGGPQPLRLATAPRPGSAIAGLVQHEREDYPVRNGQDPT